VPVRLIFQAEDPECCFHRPEKSPVKRVHFRPVAMVSAASANLAVTPVSEPNSAVA